MKKDSYVLINEQGKVLLNRNDEGTFMTQIYPMLVNELIDKLKINSDKYSGILIDLKQNRYDMNTIISVAEILGYYIKDVEFKELDRMKHTSDEQIDNKYHIRRIDTNFIEEHKKKRDDLLKLYMKSNLEAD